MTKQRQKRKRHGACKFTAELGEKICAALAAGPEVSSDIRSLFFVEKQLKGAMASDIADLEWGLEQVRVGKVKPLLDREFIPVIGGEKRTRSRSLADPDRARVHHGVLRAKQ